MEFPLTGIAIFCITSKSTFSGVAAANCNFYRCILFDSADIKTSKRNF